LSSLRLVDGDRVAHRRLREFEAALDGADAHPLVVTERRSPDQPALLEPDPFSHVSTPPCFEQAPL
jgi:hypothetical protein